MSNSSTRPRGGLEREVLASLAAADRALTAAEVLNEIGGGLAYTTVMTALSRLHTKGVLTRESSGKAYKYSLVGASGDVDSSLTAHQMHRALDAGEDRARVLARFVADLSPEDEQVLLQLLANEPESERGN
jgi:predicted transcriptional regulator